MLNHIYLSWMINLPFHPPRYQAEVMHLRHTSIKRFLIQTNEFSNWRIIEEINEAPKGASNITNRTIAVASFRWACGEDSQVACRRFKTNNHNRFIHEFQRFRTNNQKKLFNLHIKTELRHKRITKSVQMTIEIWTHQLFMQKTRIKRYQHWWELCI